MPQYFEHRSRFPQVGIHPDDLRRMELKHLREENALLRRKLEQAERRYEQACQMLDKLA